MRMKLKLVIHLGAVLIGTVSLCAQLSPEKAEQIDGLFRSWNQPNSPGGVVGIWQKDKLLFRKAYGLASLEYLAPNTTGTLFNLASVSKQMTAMGIVKLHLEGKLSVDDDIRKHLTDLPDFGEKITIRHMLHHTSGLRSMHGLLQLAGWRGDDMKSNDDLYRFMLKQRDLNFKPGDEYLYCNTGYVFMAKIVAKVTGESFITWMKREIFEPLGMAASYYEDNHASVITNRATSYQGSYAEGFDRSVEYWSYFGSGNVFSTIDDLLRWTKNFYDPTPGWGEAFKMLETVDPLNDGKVNNYAFGVSVTTLHGHKRIQHTGATGGYRSIAAVFPDSKLSVAVLSNFSSSNPQTKATKAAEIILGHEDESDPPEDSDSTSSHKQPEALKLSPKELEAFAGTYWIEKGDRTRKIHLQEQALVYQSSESNQRPLTPIAKNEFMLPTSQDPLILRFDRKADGALSFTVLRNGEVLDQASRQPENPSPATLKEYTGKFYSPELETTYTVFLKNDKLTTHHTRHGDIEATLLKTDVVRWLGWITRYQRNDDGKVTGLLATQGGSQGRVRNVWMEKLE